MTLITWRNEFETGIAEVDHEHRELVALINRLADDISAGADKARIQAFLGEVFARIAAHFALEESVMLQHAYDDYAAHKAEHENLLDEIRDIMDQAEASYSQSLSTTVGDWFVGHFKTMDARLHKKLGV
jgi:hemerythrin